MRIFLVCKKGRGTRRELLGLYTVNDAAQLIAEVSKLSLPTNCLAIEAELPWTISFVGRINPNQRKAFLQSTYLCDATLDCASDQQNWRELSEIV